MSEFDLSSKKKNLYQNLINNLQKAYNDKINPIGIIQMFIKLSKDIDKEFIKRLKDFNMKVGTHSKGVWQREINALAGEVLR